MKKLKRLTVGQLDEMEKLSINAQRHIVGGSGCVWNCLAYVWDAYDGTPTSKKEYEEYMKVFKDKWREYQGSHVLPNGDPAASQSGDLFDFISCFFNTTTGSGWGTSNWGSMISSSGAINHESGYSYSGMAFVVIGDDTNQHALVINGDKKLDNITQKYYYECYDPDHEIETIYADKIRYGTGLG